MIARASRVLALSAIAAALIAQPSYAAPPLPAADVWINSWGGSFAELCGAGDMNDGDGTIARWVFTVTGAASDRSPIGPYVQVEDGDTFAYCDTYYIGSPPDAAFTVTLTFAGLDATPPTDAVTSDVAGTAVLVYEWNSVLGHDNQFSFGSTG